MATDDGEPGVLRNKRDASSYRILVEVADRQPAVSQQEIADAVGVTSQAVSDYVRDLVNRGFIEKGGRGRYEVTKEGVNWLIGETDDLRAFTERVTTEILGEVEVDTAVATGDIEEGETVSLSMREGVLHATPGSAGSATAVAVTAAATGADVGVTDFEGMVEYDPGRVTIVSIPPVTEGGSDALAPDRLREAAADHDRLAVSGTEAYAATTGADLTPDIRFGTEHGVAEAAVRGLDVLLLAVAGEAPGHTARLREESVAHEVRDAAEF